MNRILAVLAALAMLPYAMAGTPDAPEVTDPTGDNIGAAFPLSADIVSMWIDDAPVDGTEDNPQLFLHIDVAQSFTHGSGLFAQHTQFRVDMIGPDGQGRYLTFVLGSDGIDDAVPAGTDKTLGCRGGSTDGENYADIPAQITFNGQIESDTRYGCIFPASFLGSYGAGDTISGLKAGFYQTTRGPTNGGDEIPVTELVAYDETAVGTEYALPFQEEIVLPKFNETIDSMPFVLNQSMSNLNASYTYTWKGTNATVHEFNGTLSLESGTTFIRVTDPAGDVQFEATYTGPFDTPLLASAFAVPEGNWTVQVDHTEATGSLNFILTPDPLPMEQNNDSMEQNETNEEPMDDGEPMDNETEDSPGFGAIFAIASLGAIAFLRRK